MIFSWQLTGLMLNAPPHRPLDERALGTIVDILNKMFESPPPLLKVLCKPNYGLEIWFY